MKAIEAVEAFERRLGELDDPAVFISVADDELAEGWADGIDRRDPAEVPLRGLVFAVKDNIDVAGLPTTAGCPAFAYRPTRSATVVDQLLAAGAIPVAKTNMDQFATGLVGTRSPYGTPSNPHNPDHVPGGSSSGSAVAVARGLVDFALSTDTAGSGRVPAAFCGIVGLKPTCGLISTTGTVPAVRSADCVSIMARDVEAARRVLEHAAGFDQADPFSRPTTLPRERTRGDVRLGRVSADALASAGATPEVVAAYEQAVRVMSDPAAAHDVDLGPFLEVGDLLYSPPWVAERTASVGDFIEEHRDEVDPVVASIIDTGRNIDAAAVHRARYRLAELRRECEQTWDRVDVLVLPTVPRAALLSDVAADPVGVSSELGRFTTFANLLDLGAISMPTAARDGHGVPLGVTLYAPAFCEASLIELAAVFS